MDFKQLLQRIDSLGGKQQLNEGSKEDMEYYFGKDKKDSKPAGEKETGTGHMAKKTDKGTQYTKKDLPGQDTSKDADTKAAEKKAKKKASEDISDLLKTLSAIAEGKKEVDEEQTEEGNEFSGELAKAKAAGKKEFEVDGKKYQVKEAEDKEKNDKDKDADLDEADESDDDEDDKDDKKDLKESVLDEKAAPGQEDWVKSNKEKFIKQYGKKKGLEVLYATSWKRSKSVKESAALQECYDQAMMGGRPEQESGMNINASTDTRTGSKSLTVTAQGDAAEQLAQLLKLSGVSHGGDQQHDAEMEEAAYVNTPEPEVQGIEVQMQQGNDLNRPKNSFKHSYRQGDNPMAMREEELRSIEQRLNEELAQFKVIAEKKGKPDFLDMDKDGDRKEPMKKAIADKSKKKVSEQGVAEGRYTPPKNTYYIMQTSINSDEGRSVDVFDLMYNGKIIKRYNLLASADRQLRRLRAAGNPVQMEDEQGVAEGDVEESGLQAYLGNKKYGRDGMDALRKAGREGASKEKMAKIRAQYDK